MDLIYGKLSAEGNDQNKRQKTTLPALPSLPSLPIHLPNMKPQPTQVPTPTSAPTPGEFSADAAKETSLVPGAAASLETQGDIDEWIKQRKANWMKRISNKKAEEAKAEAEKTANTTDTRTQTKPQHNQSKNQNTRTQRKGKNQTQEKNQAQNRRQNRPQEKRNPRFNLNKELIQRGLTDENEQLLDVIKELFDQGLLSKPE